MEDKTLLNFLILLFVDLNLTCHEMSKPRVCQSKLGVPTFWQVLARV